MSNSFVQHVHEQSENVQQCNSKSQRLLFNIDLERYDFEVFAWIRSLNIMHLESCILNTMTLTVVDWLYMHFYTI